MRGWLVVLGMIAALANPAAAERNPEVAKRLFDEGRVLYDQRKFIEACVLFEKSYQLDPAVGTKLNLAECAERDDKPRAAWLLWMSAAAEFARDDDDRERFARKRADALAPKLATVVVKLAKPKQKGLTVAIAGRDVEPAAEIVDRLDPGAIAVVARAPGRDAFETTVTVALGGTVTVEIPALPKIGGREDKELSPGPEQHGNPWRLAAVASGALTLAVVGYSFYATSQIRRTETELGEVIRESSPNPTQEDRAKVDALNAEGEGWARRANISVVAAGVGLVATTVLVVKAIKVHRRNRAAATAFQLAPVIAPKLAGAQLQLSW